MFSPLFSPLANPEAIVNSKLTLAFLRQGWEIDVISRECGISSGYDYGSKWVDPWLPLKSVTHEVQYEVGGFLRKSYETARSALRFHHLILGCRWAEHAFHLAMKLHAAKPYHIILSRSLPDSGHLPALGMAKVTKLPWVANWNDATDVKNPPPSGKGADAPAGYLKERYLNDIARTAAWHTFPSDRMRSHICSYLNNGTENKSSTIPHVALEREQPIKVRKGQTFTLCYAGNLYSGRNPELFLKALKTFIDEKGLNEICKFNFIGLESIGLSKLIKDYDLEQNIIFSGPLSYIETFRQFSDSDVLVVLEAAYSEGIYLPSKFVDYVQVGKPVLAISPPNGTLNDIIKQFGGGIFADCASEEQIRNALDRLYHAWLDDSIEREYGSNRLYKLFSPELVIQQYIEIFSKISPNYNLL